MKSRKLEPYIRTIKEIGPIIFRHTFILINGVIFTVVILLFYFGNPEIAVFLGVITVFNMMLGIIQDTRARIALETLQLITALKVTHIDESGNRTDIFIEDVKKGYHLDVKLGDQIPCDGVLLDSKGLEVSEALITGESVSFTKEVQSIVLAGSIVTAGRGVLEVTQSFKDSRISKMTEEAKQYSVNPSPIEHAVYTIIRYSSYCLVVVIIFIITRGFILHEPSLNIVLNIGAIASMIVPQGLVVITTLLFAFGAASYSKKHVLFQEINTTEKLGRIKNLCMDKTGTLTNNIIDVENMYVRDGIDMTYARNLANLYVNGSGDSSQTLLAVGRYLSSDPLEGDVLKAIPFSSWRKYGSVLINTKNGNESVIIGSTETLLNSVSVSNGKNWLIDVIKKYEGSGKRILCVAKSRDVDLSKELDDINISIVGVFVFESGFRQGVEKAIDFFQKRGVHIRIISGDSPDTVKTVAEKAGIKNTDDVITGKEMEMWGTDVFDKNVEKYTIFARISPEQKVKIIESLKKTGFTAMIGDGANDALAIKKSDIGIAMFDGVPATRRLASVVLMKNSFSDLPGGVELADNFIRNITVLASVFINSSLIGFLFFVVISLFGYAYPITPLNITFTNYFIVGIPSMLIGYWAIRPSTKTYPANSENFLQHILPFIFWSSIIETIGLVAIFFMSPESIRSSLSSMPILISLILSGYIFFAFAPSVYRGKTTVSEKLHLLGLAIFEVILFFLIINIPPLVKFFSLSALPPMHLSLEIFGVFGLVAVIEYVVVKKFFLKKVNES